MKGKRLPDAVMGEAGPGWDAFFGEKHKLKAKVGDYMLVRSEGDGLYLYFVDPTGHQGTVIQPADGSEGHSITEEEDGTITVSPSILAIEAEHGHDWHGHLQHGVWSDA